MNTYELYAAICDLREAIRGLRAQVGILSDRMTVLEQPTPTEPPDNLPDPFNRLDVQLFNLSGKLAEVKTERDELAKQNAELKKRCDRHVDKIHALISAIGEIERIANKATDD